MEKIINYIQSKGHVQGVILAGECIIASFTNREKPVLNISCKLPEGVYKETPTGFTIIDRDDDTPAVLAKIQIIDEAFLWRKRWTSSTGEEFVFKDARHGSYFKNPLTEKVALPTAIGRDVLTCSYTDPETGVSEDLRVRVDIFKRVD